jgi:hypothetical protein
MRFKIGKYSELEKLTEESKFLKKAFESGKAKIKRINDNVEVWIS